MTHDGLVVSRQLEEYLLSKLGKDHAGVKYKVLRIIRFACENGCSLEFRRLLQKRADVIRVAMSFRGSPDPLRGDSPNKAVRDEAGLVLKSLFEYENSGKTQVSAARVQGVGSEDYVAPVLTPSYTSSSGSRKMESMGNPHFENFDSGRNISSSTRSMSDIMNSENPTRELISVVSSGVQSLVDSVSKKFPAQFLSSSSVVGNEYSSHLNGPRSDWVPPKLNLPSSSLESSIDLSGTDVKSVVYELCISNPARVVPSPQSMRTFVAKSSEVDGVALAESIKKILSDPKTQWVQKMKVLAGIEALHAAGLDVVTESIKEAPAALFGLFSSPQCGGKAKAVAACIGLIDSANMENRVRYSSASLIDMSEEGELIEVEPSNSSSSIPNLKIADRLDSRNLIDFTESSLI